jgi:sec-independent protein translocase protein TatB
MLEIGWGKIVIIGVVALLVIGPKELPVVLRTLGQWMTKLRRMAAEFQSQFQEAMREAEMADLKKQVDEITGKAQTYANFDPVAEVRRDFETTQHQIENAIRSEPSPNPENVSPQPGSPSVARVTGDEPAPAASRDAQATLTHAAGSNAPATEPGPAEPVESKAEGKPA